MKSYGQFIDKSIALDESNFVARRFDASRFGPGGNNNTKKPPLQATSKRNPDLLKDGPRKLINTVKRINQDRKNPQSKFSQSFKKNVDKPTRNIRDKVRNATNFITRQATRPEVRSVASGFKKVRNALPTAADFAPTSQSGLGLGGTLSGRSLKGIGNAVNAGLSADRFEKSDVKTYSKAGLGQRKKNLQYINRGRRINPETGEPINEPKDTSFKGQAKNFIKDKLGIRDKVDEPKKPDEDKGANKVTTTGNIPDDDNSGSKVTTGKGKPNPSSGSAAASTSDDSKTASTDASPTARQPRKIRKRFNLFKKDPEPDKRVRIDEPKTDPSKLNTVKGFKDKPEPKQENIPGIKTEKKPETEKKPRKKRTPEEIAASNKKRQETKARKKEEASKKSGQGTIDFNKDQRNQSRKDAADKAGVKTKGGKTITGDTQPEITGTSQAKVTSSNNVDKTPKPVEQPVKPEKPAGKKRGPKKGSTNVRTLARQNREKKQQETQAKERLASAVKKQEEQDKKNPIEQAKQDSKTSTALKGSNLDRNRKELAKMLKLTPSSKQKKSTQIQGISDEELARSGGSKKNIDDLIIKAKKGEAKEQEKLVNKEEEKTNKKKTINPNAPKSSRKNVKKSYKTTNKKKETTKNEEFSHWREEFLWEVDKKYPDKVKEIKPMTGKNTITINPEDESSKYKRGY